MEAMKFLLLAALVLSLVCLALALFHWVRLRRDLKERHDGIATQTPLWLEFPRAFTRQGRHHQRRFLVYIIVFIILLIVLFVLHGAGVLSI